MYIYKLYQIIYISFQNCNTPHPKKKKQRQLTPPGAARRFQAPALVRRQPVIFQSPKVDDF